MTTPQSTNWFICTISEGGIHNWDLCKGVSLWGIPSNGRNLNMSQVEPGDGLLFYWAGKGLIGHALTTGVMKRPQSKDEAPWAGEINTETNPFEAGLGFALSLKKENFHGKAAVISAKENQSRKLVAITFDDISSVPFGSEPIRIDNKIVGRVKSGGQGYTINKAIAYAYLPIEDSVPGTAVDVELFGVWCKGVIAAEPLFDATNLKIRS